MKKFFITGTDTDIGKTYVSVRLLKNFNKLGLKTIGLKPVATGCIDGYNEDALLLQKYSSLKLDYSLINPFAFAPAVSPNIACLSLTVDEIWNALQDSLKTQADICIIEGVGGFMAPINSKETMADLVERLYLHCVIPDEGIEDDEDRGSCESLRDIPGRATPPSPRGFGRRELARDDAASIEIILVIGIRLGCLNHSLLTYEAIKTRNLPLKGWIANIIDPSMKAINENIATLKKYIKEPCLEIIKYDSN